MGDKNPKNMQKQKKIHEKQKEEQNAKVLHMKRTQEKNQNNQQNAGPPHNDKDFKKAS